MTANPFNPLSKMQLMIRTRDTLQLRNATIDGAKAAATFINYLQGHEYLDAYQRDILEQKTEQFERLKVECFRLDTEYRRLIELMSKVCDGTDGLFSTAPVVKHSSQKVKAQPRPHAPKKPKPKRYYNDRLKPR